jgi:hypothetical protein
MDKRQGISKRFLGYLHSLDQTIGEKLFGHKETTAGEQQDKEKGTAGETSDTGAAAGIARHPTVSGKAQETVAGIRDRAVAIDEQKGYSKQASSVRSKNSAHLISVLTIVNSITRGRSTRHSGRRCSHSTRALQSRSWTFTKRQSESLQRPSPLLLGPLESHTRKQYYDRDGTGVSFPIMTGL